eukprot:3461025-Pleurochrysis_carterae.AAC.1
MRSRWERSTRSVAVLRPVSLARRLAIPAARRPRGAARAEKLGSRSQRLARAIEPDSLVAGLVAVARVMVVMAGVMVAVARVMEVVDAMPEAGAKASPH